MTSKLLLAASIGVSIPLILSYYLKKKRFRYPNLIDFKEINEYFNENYEECLINWSVKYPNGCTLELGAKDSLLKGYFKQKTDDKIILLNSVDSIKQFSKNNLISNRPQLFLLDVISHHYLGSFFRMYNDDLINVRKTSLNGLEKLVSSNPDAESLILDELERFFTFIENQILPGKQTGVIENAQIFIQQVIVNIIFRVGLDIRFDYELTANTPVKIQIGLMSKLLSALNTFELSKITSLNASSNLYSKTVESLGGIVNSIYSFITGAVVSYKTNSKPTDDIKTIADLLLRKQREEILKRKSLESCDLYSDDDIIVQVFTVFLAACGSTGFTLSWALHYLSKAPEVVAKIIDEISNTCGKTNFINLSHRSSMLYTEAVINEILRLSSTKALIPRATTKETNINGLHIPANTPVLLNTFGIHHNEQNWKSPYEFKPERWFNEDGTSLKRNQETFMPFGIQPRSCIGDKLAKILLFSILTNIINRYSINYEAISTEKRNNVGILGVFRCPYEFNLKLQNRNK